MNRSVSYSRPRVFPTMMRRMSVSDVQSIGDGIRQKLGAASKVQAVSSRPNVSSIVRRPK